MPTKADVFEPTMLEATPFPELWDEIKRRHTGAVLVFDGVPPGSCDSSTVSLCVLYHGCSKAHCLGLAEFAALRLKQCCEYDELEPEE